MREEQEKMVEDEERRWVVLPPLHPMENWLHFRGFLQYNKLGSVKHEILLGVMTF